MFFQMKVMIATHHDFQLNLFGFRATLHNTQLTLNVRHNTSFFFILFVYAQPVLSSIFPISSEILFVKILAYALFILHKNI